MVVEVDKIIITIEVLVIDKIIDMEMIEDMIIETDIIIIASNNDVFHIFLIVLNPIAV